jgi:cytidine deaminase
MTNKEAPGPDFATMARMAIRQLELAQCSISGHRVGAAVSAKDYFGSTEIFGASNIELAISVVYHAEVLALLHAINAGYTKPTSVYVTSTNPKKAAAAMCGICRQHYMWANPNCEVFVIDTEANLRLHTKVVDTLLHPYLGRGKLHV